MFWCNESVLKYLFSSLEFGPNEPVENLIPNGRLKDFKVGFNDLRESHGPPPEGPALQRPAERR